jgi:hypothetical protein
MASAFNVCFACIICFITVSDVSLCCQCSEKSIYMLKPHFNTKNEQKPDVLKRYMTNPNVSFTNCFPGHLCLLCSAEDVSELLLQMTLQLRGAVILLDEAHNIEDCCRDAGSYSVSYYDIFQAMEDCKRVASMKILPEIHNNLVQNYVFLYFCV